MHATNLTVIAKRHFNMATNSFLQLPSTAAHGMRGMTLIEVLVALVIIAVALSAAIRSVNAGVANTDYLKQKSFAHWVAMNNVAEQQAEGLQGPTNKWSETELAGRNWHINTKAIVTADNAILRIETRVYRERDDEAPLANIVSFTGTVSSSNFSGVKQ